MPLAMGKDNNGLRSIDDSDYVIVNKHDDDFKACFLGSSHLIFADVVYILYHISRL